MHIFPLLLWKVVEWICEMKWNIVKYCVSWLFDFMSVLFYLDWVIIRTVKFPSLIIHIFRGALSKQSAWSHLNWGLPLHYHAIICSPDINLRGRGALNNTGRPFLLSIRSFVLVFASLLFHLPYFVRSSLLCLLIEVDWVW